MFTPLGVEVVHFESDCISDADGLEMGECEGVLLVAEYAWGEGAATSCHCEGLEVRKKAHDEPQRVRGLGWSCVTIGSEREAKDGGEGSMTVCVLEREGEVDVL